MPGVHVGMADLISAKHPATLTTLGLGSCIGLVLYDQTAKAVSMVHIMLPDSRDTKDLQKPGKFADTAIPLMLKELEALGALRSRLKAKLAGGAQMFSLPGKENSILAVGTRNSEVTLALLKKHGIPIIASDVGGNKGRSVEFNTETWAFTVKTIGTGIKVL